MCHLTTSFIGVAQHRVCWRLQHRTPVLRKTCRVFRWMVQSYGLDGAIGCERSGLPHALPKKLWDLGPCRASHALPPPRSARSGCSSTSPGHGDDNIASKKALTGQHDLARVIHTIHDRGFPPLIRASLEHNRVCSASQPATPIMEY